MKSSKSSARWLQEKSDDIYSKKARQEGYRSRASYKLLELDQKDTLFFSGMRVLDLGAAPGGWSQVATKKVGPTGTVIASDLLAINPINDVTFIQGDFTSQPIFDTIIRTLNKKNVHLVMSDMAPNISGIASSDQSRALYLVELALDIAQKILVPQGAFVVKLFQGEGFDTYLKDVRQRFNKVIIRKPKASRPRSREVYLVCKELSHNR
jgi:23S rRNA (uridine2552-2'-O)-methyltransferase